MTSYPLPANEKQRVKALHKYNLLDGITTQEYDRITKIASEICNTPVSLLTLLDEQKQWVKSSYGFPLKQTPRELAFCNYTILDTTQVLEVADMRKDERFSNNPLVASDPHVVFYAGAPLVTPQGFALGSICVLDREEKKLNDNQRDALVALSQQVMNSFELKINIRSLKQTQRKLKEANEKLKSYAHVVSHDLKTPVSNIKMLTRVLEEEHLVETCSEQKEIVRLIQESAASLLSFIDALLNRSKITNRNTAQSKMVDTHQLVKKIVRMLAPPDDISICVDAKLPKVKTDQLALQQVFQNLLTNAIKYNDKSDPLINVTCFSNNCYHSFVVEDNGSGIPLDKLETLFEARVAGSEPDRFGNHGTGFGLYNIKRCLSEIGGKIEVSSKQGSGSRFTFHVPA